MEQRRKGVTLIEALFVLGLMAIIIGLVMLFVSQADIKKKNSQYIQELGSIRQALHDLCDSNPKSCNNKDMTQTLAQSGLLSQKYTYAQQVVDPYGSTMSPIVVFTLNGVSMMTLASYIHNLPQCNAIMEYANTDQALWKMAGNATPDQIMEACKSTSQYQGSLFQMELPF
ncbi:pilus assembly FimT family protein [Acetobacter aceti]|nr:prepilin-type N-terminal cleavage/methylation domain-containing protein [Acetobacter aceti]